MPFVHPAGRYYSGTVPLQPENITPARQWLGSAQKLALIHGLNRHSDVPIVVRMVYDAVFSLI